MKLPPHTVQIPSMTTFPVAPLFSRRTPAALFTVCLLVVAGWAASADAALITFAELPNQPADGVSLQGAAFHFTIGGVASTDARFNSVALGSNTTLNLQTSTLEGNADGVLTVDFAQPISLLSFNVARLTGATLTGATVSLFDSALVGFATTPVTISKLVTYSEALYSYVGSTPVKRAVLTFNPGAGPRFAIDNLTFTPVPEPGTMLAGLLLTGFAACARLPRRRH